MVILGSKIFSTGSVEIKGVFVSREHRRGEMKGKTLWRLGYSCSRHLRSDLVGFSIGLLQGCVEFLRSVSECKVVGRCTTENLFTLVQETISRRSSGSDSVDVLLQADLRSVSQPLPSMPAWSHYGVSSTEPSHRLFLLLQQLKYIKKIRERWEKFLSRVSLSLHPLNPSAAANSDLSRGGRRFPISGHRGWWARHSVQAALLSFSPPCTVLLVLMELFHRIFAVCARIWVRSEIRDPIEPLKGRYFHAPASSSRSSRSSLSVRPKLGSGFVDVLLQWSSGSEPAASVDACLEPLRAAANSDLSRCGRRFPISGHRGWWARHSVQAALLSFSPPCTVLLVLMELFHRIFVVCARIWVRSEIRDPIEPLKGRYRHAPASSSRSSRSPLSVRPKPQVYTSSSVEIARVWFCRRPPPVELREVSQPPPSMPAWSHFGECSTDPTLQLFFLSQQVCSGLSNKVLVRDP
ncbi:hypothetical protein F2Q68_00002550 [Brassica cretica]|uniref:Uncharacterized protein n=1 Tax=Brassica cretica TaxID=69181 RepID=A0A8S9JHS5_BRACR|nr:hypothetical protein F2Q68_00002550 [Brassica cretica]